MSRNLTKRILSLVLTIALLLSNFPMAAFAVETAETHEHHEEHTAETEVVAEPTTAPEIVAPTEAATEPAEETTAPAQPEALPEETVAPTEAFEEIIREELPTFVPDVTLPDNRELHAAFIRQSFYGKDTSLMGSAAGAKLTGDDKVLYDALVKVIKQIANGERASTFIKIGKTVSYGGETYDPDVEVTFNTSSFDLRSILSALLADLAYEQYWYDKTSGVACSYFTRSGKLYQVQFWFSVPGNYAGPEEYTVDTAKTGAAAAAVNNARSIVSKYAGLSDYEKLVAYSDEICALVDYDFTAAGMGNFYENDDPWQMISVFDGNPATNVVCEGYSKAFMYLCDESSFSGDTTCYTVTGDMSGGGHMWNVVTIDGNNYLVDVTNSDDGSVGMYGGLFLAGTSGDPVSGYVFLGYRFRYDDNTLNIWGTGEDSILRLASTDYEPGEEPAPSEPVDPNIVASGTCGENLTWVLDDEGTLTISGTGKMADYSWSGSGVPWYSYRTTISTVVVEAGVTSIGDYAFAYCSSLTSADIGNGVTSIGNYAFSNCSSLTSVDIGNGVTSIGGSAFRGCSSLTSIVIPDSVTSIGHYAFYDCRSLTSIVIPDSVTSIGSFAFWCCSSLTSVDIGNGVTSIGSSAFYMCSSLTSIVIPDSVTSIGHYAFSTCSSLTSVDIGNGVTSIGESAFIYCSSLTNITIPDSVTSIGNSAFSNCSRLREITFKGDAPTFGVDVFNNVTATAYYPANNPTWTADVMQNYGGNINWVAQCASHNVVTDPGVDPTCTETGLTEGSHCAVCGEVFAEQTVIPALGHDMGDWVVTTPATCEEDGEQRKTCSRCDYYETEVIPATGHNYVDGVCTGCGAIENAVASGTCGENLTWVLDDEGTLTISGTGAMKNYASPYLASFYTTPWNRYRDSICTVVIESGVTSIGDFAFYNCERLKCIEISDSVTRIGDHTFYWCRSVENIKIPDSVISIGNQSFLGCSSLTSIEIPDSVTSIGEYVFQSCSNLREIMFKGDAPTFGVDVFYDVTATAYYPAGNATWTADVMQNYGGNITWTALQPPVEIVASGKCGENLTWVLDIEGTLTISGTGTMTNFAVKGAPWYDYRDSVRNAVIDNGVTSIGGNAFSYCSALTSITIPASVTSIGGYAFYDCSGLTSITIPASVTRIENSVFSGCSSLKSVVIEDGVTNIGNAAFSYCSSLTSIVIPASVTSIGNSAFNRSDNLIDIYYGGIDTQWTALSNRPAAEYIHYSCTNPETHWVVEVVAADCENAGYTCEICACGYERNKQIIGAALGHAEVTAPAVPVTCTEPGLTEGSYCSRCGEVFSKQTVIPALGHDMGDWVVTTHATCEEDGEQRKICSRCDHYEAEAIPATGHNYENGTCTECGETEGGKDENIIASGTCGENLTWVLYEDGKLVVSGNGPMLNAEAPAPWEGFLHAIRTLVIEDGITSIGNRMFEFCYELRHVTIGNTVNRIGEYAFTNNGNLMSVIIGNSVTEIGDHAFDGCNSLANVTFGRNVTRIGNGAFNYCANLTKITLPDGLTTIGDEAFIWCSGLAEVTIPDSVTTIGEAAFSSCLSLTSITIPGSVTSIGLGAFTDCENLKCVTLEDGLTTIGNSMFWGCRALETVEIPDSVTHIGEYAFIWCVGLQSIEIPDSVTHIGEYAFSCCERLQSIEIPDSVTHIGAYAFEGCSLSRVTLGSGVARLEDGTFARCWNLRTIEIPENVTYMGNEVFRECGNPLQITFTGDAPEFSENTFFDATANVYYPLNNTWTDDVLNGYYGGSVTWVHACTNHNVVTDYGFGPTCTEDGMTDGQHCSICGKVITAQEYAFALGHDMGEWIIYRRATCTDSGEQRRYCSRCDFWEYEEILPLGHDGEGNRCLRCGLTTNAVASGISGNLTWNLNEWGVLTISGNGAMKDFGVIHEDDFWYDYYPSDWLDYSDQIRTVVIKDGVTSIGIAAFNACSNLMSVTIADTVTSIGGWAFYGLDDLTSIKIPDNVTIIGDEAFDGCSSLTSIEIPDSVTDIGKGAFWGCTGLTRVTLGSGVTVIDEVTFAQCENLKQINIPDTVTYIGGQAFYGCRSLTSIEIPDSVTDIGFMAFNFCENLKCVTLGNGVENIGHGAFGGCYSLTRIEIPASVKWIDYCAFETCSALKEIEFRGDAPEFGKENWQEVFFGVTAIAYYPKNNSTWTIDKRQNYGGNMTWVEKCMDHTGTKLPAVEPTCTETGLTEGSRCTKCDADFVPQQVIPARGHDFARTEKGIVCNACGEQLYISMREYILMDQQDSNKLQLTAEVSPAELAKEVQWTVEGEDGIISVNRKGKITALRTGTAYAVATVRYGEFEVSNRTRIDVIKEIEIAGIQLSTDKLTSELYSTDYAGFEILLQLPQNNQFAAMGMEDAEQNLGIAIESARFENETMAELFEIRVLDDRNVEIVPTDYAVNNPKTVAGKYTGKVIVTVQGEEFASETMTLTVKKTLPKLKATVAAFNSFYSGQSQQITITGGTAIKVYPNPAQKAALPNWLNLIEDGTLTLNEQAPLKNASAKAYILVDTVEWRIPAAVTVSVKNTYKARGLKLSAATVTFTTIAENSNGVKLNLLATSKNETLADLKVTGITAPAGYIVENFNIADGSFTLKTESGFKAGTVYLNVIFSDTDVTQPLKLTVKTAKVTLKASSTKATLNITRNDSAVIDITATPADYQITDSVITLTGTELVNGKKTTVDKLNSGELDIAFEDGKIKIATTSKTPDKASYKLSISAGGSKAVTITINTVSGNPAVTFKASGSMDLSFPNQAATITPTFKNCGGGFDSFEYTIAEMKGKTVVSENVSDAFEITRDGKIFKIKCVDESINTANTYALKLKLILEDGSSVENTISLKVKRTAVKLKLSATKLTLNKLIGDKASVDVSCTTKGYDFIEPVLELKDSKNKDAAGQLDIAFNNGKLNIATNDYTVYGTTYKVLVKADAYAPASTLTVTIPKEAGSTVTATVKASGAIDVIRDGSAITLTPAYKNVTAQTEKIESLTFYKTANKVTMEANELFDYTVNANGTITVKKAEGAQLDHSAKYTVKLVTDVNGSQVCESKPISISVKMGSTKLTLKAADTMLFAQDKHDRVVFRFDSADKTLNDVVKVEIKDAKYKDMFEILDYGNGQFAIGFKDSNVSETLIGKKASLDVTLNLNVFIEGNETTKANTTAKIKLTIVK